MAPPSPTLDHAPLQTTDERERLLLAPYATFSAHSRGRKYPEETHAYRGPFQRDRDRILHSAAYRRLSDKTQVFTGVSDYHRTRLTHTQEVASIARTVGRALRLNEDLIEALALVHDIGHPPLGHAGEDALSECLAEEGGFSHNRFALTLVEELEVRHSPYPGLNLTREVLDGQRRRIDKTDGDTMPSLEVQIVDAADTITYDAHDTDDALKLGFLSLDELRELPIVGECLERKEERESENGETRAVGAARSTLGGERLHKALVHALIDYQVTGLLEETARRLEAAELRSASQAVTAGFRVGCDPALAAKKAELEAFLFERLYRHPQLIAERRQGQGRIRRLFDFLTAHPQELPDPFQRRARSVGLARAVGDYVAALTDRSCSELCDRLLG